MYITPSQTGKKLESYINHVKRLEQNLYTDDVKGRTLKTRDLNFVGKNYHRKRYYASIVKYCTTSEKYKHLLDFLMNKRGFISKMWKIQGGFDF